jgi:myo-inositol-1(or 4)-monophosphatase
VSPDLSSLMPIALRAIALGEAHVHAHHPRLVTSKGDRDMVTDVDLAIPTTESQRSSRNLRSSSEQHIGPRRLCPPFR